MTDGNALFDFEKELTCSICTEILYQPLTLLDCLHSYCGGCLKEWFNHQKGSAISSRRTRSNPYTCPSCREPVRGTKADWRITAPLEGFLKAHPERDRTAEDKEEMSKLYRPGDNVLPPVPVPTEENASDSEDERLLAEISALSMEHLDDATMRERLAAARENYRRRTTARRNRARPEELSAQQQPSRWAMGRAERQQEAEERQVEHQPSLRSLLSGSNIQEEILQSIYSEGLLEGINLESLTTAQEEELTERIAEAYRRRQRNRDRSRHRERQNESGRASQHPGSGASSPSRRHARAESASTQTPPRSRPPISRPHLFEQGSTDPSRIDPARNARHHRRTGSASSQRSPQQTDQRNESRQPIAPAARSATDLSQSPATDEDRRRRQRASSSNARSSTNPEGMRTNARDARAASTGLRPEPSSPRARSHEPSSRDIGRRPAGNSSNSTSSVPVAISNSTTTAQSIRPAASRSAFAPEPVISDAEAQLPQVSCSRCNKSGIQKTVHYNCSTCADGAFNLCLACYRAGRGCHHWFGFGFMANDKWQRMQPPEGYPPGYERPHILMARRYLAQDSDGTTLAHPLLQEGAFCESCHSYADEGYWYCDVCLAGAWGFCRACTLRGKHCTHPILSVRRAASAAHQHGKPTTLPIPHLPADKYTYDAVHVDCDICHFPIPTASPRFHCNECSDGDYDICARCYRALCATGKISSVDGEDGWRRCPQRHRMSVVTHDNAKRRIVVRDKIGGVRLKEDEGLSAFSTPPVPGLLQNPTGAHYGALWSYFPNEANVDELSFPRGAEVAECEDLNEDWSVGVYAGLVGVFPRNHTRKF